MRLDLSREFNPAPKLTKPNRKKKKQEKYKGVTIPSRKVRAAISKTDYEKALAYWGGCAETGSTLFIEMHHAKFRSQGGRGGWRNLVPLVGSYHKKCHAKREYAEMWRHELKKRFGEWYWADRFDLWKAGLIPNCTHEAFEKFMEGEANAKVGKVQTLRK